MPSRRDKILIFTIVGWAACQVFHFVAYSMAKEDLAMMDAGVMDERDRDTINLMRILSLVGIWIFCGTLLLMCCIFGMQMTMIGGSSSYGGGYGGY